jgi:hypothetical protein
VIAAVIVIGAVLIYALGRSDGRNRLKNQIRDMFIDPHRGRK